MTPHGSIAGTIGGALTAGLADLIIGSTIIETEKICHFGLVFITEIDFRLQQITNSFKP